MLSVLGIQARVVGLALARHRRVAAFLNASVHRHGPTADHGPVCTASTTWGFPTSAHPAAVISRYQLASSVLTFLRDLLNDCLGIVVASQQFLRHTETITGLCQ